MVTADQFVEWFQFIADRPGANIDACPFCGGAVKVLETYTTLLGWSGKGEDPNHVTQTCTCKENGHRFWIHRKSGNSWVCDENEWLLSGLPNCFETFIYTCAKCGGPVTREHIDKQTGKDARGLVFNLADNSKSFRTVWTCERCQISMETEFEHWQK